MPDALRQFVEMRRDGFVQLAGLISLALVVYMALVFGRFLVYWAAPGTPSGATARPAPATPPPSSGTWWSPAATRRR